MNLVEKEKELLHYWEKNKVFLKSIEQRPKEKQYVFYDGPPFATGLPHYGHILGLTSKDLFPRFWTMKGYRVERRWGWDCHGLPIENIAEKELNLQEKKDIETIGIAKFNQFCQSKVLFFAEEWKKTVQRMGKWIEFDNSYKTMDNSYMESVWHIFKALFEKGFIYEGKKILLYCPRCETPLSNAEISMDNSYKNVTEKTATVKFKLKEEKDTFILAWTTTPWTLIGNVALAVNSQLTYVKIQSGKEKLILAKDRLSEIKTEYKVLKEFKGEKLLNLEYDPLYAIPSEKKGHYVINGADQVSAEEGTGIVHMAIYGEFDYEMIKKYDLPVIQHVGSHGKLVQGPKEWSDFWFKKADRYVLQDLEDRNLLFKTEDHTHPYPFCYRCDTPLFYNAVNSWFVDIQKIKPKLLQKNKEINWHPPHFKEGRFKEIMETAPDWSISRNRFWATSIPVWKCESEDCGHLEVLGSIKELQEKAATKVANDVNLHKHVIDKIELKCKCGRKMSRIPEVLDCWFESGSMPYAAKHYPFENKKWFEENFPSDFVSEYAGQVRAWFYYMHVISVLLFDQAPFKNVVVSGNILAADGSKMSKSKKNFPDPNLIFEKYGADALRFYLMSSSLMKAQDLNFKEENLHDLYRKVIVILLNVKNFYELFHNENKVMNNSSSLYLLDKWIISKLHLTIREITNALENYDTVTACNEITAFVDGLSTWYVRRSRDRFKEKEKQAIKTLAYVLLNLAKLIAPIMPFLAEDIYLMLKKNKKDLLASVHLESWPLSDSSLIEEKVHTQMDLTREIVSRALDEREKNKIPIRQVLSCLTITGPELKKDYLDLIKEEVNVQEVKLKNGKELKLELNTTLTNELILEGISRELIRKINNYRKELNLTINDKIKLTLEIDEKIKESVNLFSAEIKKAVQAKQISFAEIKKGQEVKVGSSEIKISIKKV